MYSRSMAEVVRREIACDACGSPGERFRLEGPEWTFVMDRCEKHSGEIFDITQKKKGEFLQKRNSRRRVHVSTRDDIERQRKAGG